MEKFKRGLPGIKEEKESGVFDVQVAKLGIEATPKISSYEIPKLKKPGDGSYAATKAKYGSLASTDSERTNRARRDSRFRINPLLREPLSIQEEENRVIEQKIALKIEELSETSRSEGFESGYQDGLKKGRDEAYAEAKRESDEMLSNLKSLLEQVNGLKSAIFAANERFLMEVIFRIARTILLRDASADRDYALRLARELIEKLGARDNIKIMISEKDSASIQMLKAELQNQFGNLKNLKVESSSEIEKGGCKLETDWSAVDATIETQLRIVHDRLVGTSS